MTGRSIRRTLALALLTACTPTERAPTDGRTAAAPTPAEAPPTPPAPVVAPTPPAPVVAPTPVEPPPVADPPTPVEPPAPVALPGVLDPVAASTGGPADPATTTAADDTAAPADAAPSGPAALVAVAVAPVDHTVTWRDVGAVPAAVAAEGFHPFATGVLAGKGATLYATDAAGALVAVTVERPPGSVSGHWPAEAWAIESKDMGDRAVTMRTRVLRLRGNTRWVPQTIEGDQWIYSEDFGLARKSWKIGFFAEVKNSLVRVASNGLADPSIHYAGVLADITESKAGDIFTLSRDQDRTFVQTTCLDAACVATASTPLPPGSWAWGLSIPRKKSGVSLTLGAPYMNKNNHLLHHDPTPGWQLEAFPDGTHFAGMWPTADGGLWAQSADSLYHRDPAGAWRKVALPPGVELGAPVFAAMTGDMAELWVIGKKAGEGVVVATRAQAQTPG